MNLPGVYTVYCIISRKIIPSPLKFFPLWSYMIYYIYACLERFFWFYWENKSIFGLDISKSKKKLAFFLSNLKIFLPPPSKKNKKTCLWCTIFHFFPLWSSKIISSKVGEGGYFWKYLPLDFTFQELPALFKKIQISV